MEAGIDIDRFQQLQLFQRLDELLGLGGALDQLAENGHHVLRVLAGQALVVEQRQAILATDAWAVQVNRHLVAHREEAAALQVQRAIAVHALVAQEQVFVLVKTQQGAQRQLAIGGIFGDQDRVMHRQKRKFRRDYGDKTLIVAITRGGSRLDLQVAVSFGVQERDIGHGTTPLRNSACS